MTKNQKKNLMTHAWMIARSEAEYSGGTAREWFGWALKEAWEAFKRPVTPIEYEAPIFTANRIYQEVYGC